MKLPKVGLFAGLLLSTTSILGVQSPVKAGYDRFGFDVRNNCAAYTKVYVEFLSDTTRKWEDHTFYLKPYEKRRLVLTSNRFIYASAKAGEIGNFPYRKINMGRNFKIFTYNLNCHSENNAPIVDLDY